MEKLDFDSYLYFISYVYSGQPHEGCGKNMLYIFTVNYYKNMVISS